MNLQFKQDKPPIKNQDIPCSQREVKRLRIACWIALTLFLFVIAMAMTFGNAPRQFVNRMNVYLAPLVVGSLGGVVYAILRHRRACLAWHQEKQTNDVKQMDLDIMKSSDV